MGKNAPNDVSKSSSGSDYLARKKLRKDLYQPTFAEIIKEQCAKKEKKFYRKCRTTR